MKEALYKTARIRPDIQKQWVPVGFEAGEFVAVRYLTHQYEAFTKTTAAVYLVAKTNDFPKHIAEGSFCHLFEAALDNFTL
jgi:hypothetical protein